MTVKAGLTVPILARGVIGGIIRNALLLCPGLLPKLRGTARVMVGSLMFCTAMIGTLALRRPIWPMAARGMLGL